MNQQRTVEHILKVYKMKVVYEIDLKGVSGSIPGNRTDIDEIIAEHQRTGSFTYLILPSADRFTRAGSIHGIAMLYELLVEGIVVFFVKEDLFSDAERDRTYLGFMFDSARQAVATQGTSSTEGNTYSILDGRSPYSRRPPFGLDRLYLVGDQPMYILRNLRDGTQQMWSPETNEKDRKLLRTFEANPSRGTPNHYRKQKNEKVVLIPGDPKALALINIIMRYAWKHNWGEGLIAKYINDRARTNPDMLSATGKLWARATIWYVSRSAVYTGLGIRFMKTRSVYVKGGKTGRAIEAGITMQELATRKNPKNKRRARSEWLELPQRQLLQLLELDVRDDANEAIGSYLNSIAAGEKPQRVSRGPRKNGRLLSGILRSKQGNHRMVGYGGGRASKYLYYQTLAASSTPQTDATKVRLVPGCHLEPALLAVLQDAISNRPCIKDAIKTAVKKVVAERSRTSMKASDAEREMKQIRAQQLSLNRSLKGDDVLDSTFRSEIERLDQRLTYLKSVSSPPKVIRSTFNLDEKVEEFTKEFVKLGGAIKDADQQRLKSMLMCLVKSMVVDLDTREVEVSFALPQWMSGYFVGNSKVTLLSSFDFRTKQSGDCENQPVFARYRLSYDWTNQRYSWKRIKAA